MINVKSAKIVCVMCARDDSVVHAAITTALTAGDALHYGILSQVRAGLPRLPFAMATS